MIFAAFVTFGLAFITALHQSVAEVNDSKIMTNFEDKTMGFATSDITSVTSAYSEILTSSSFLDENALPTTIILTSSDNISSTSSLKITTVLPSSQITASYSDAITSTVSLNLTTVSPPSQITVSYSDAITSTVSLNLTTVSPPSQITVSYSDAITSTVSLNLTTVSPSSKITVNYSDAITPTVSLNLTTVSPPSQITVSYSDAITSTVSLNLTTVSPPSQITLSYLDAITSTPSLDTTVLTSLFRHNSSYLTFLIAISSSPSESIMESTFTTNPPSKLPVTVPTCLLECYINISFTMKKNSTQLGNQINEVLSYEFKNNNIKNYLYLIFLKLSAQTNTSVTYWFDLIFEKSYCDDILKQEVLEKSKQFFGKTVNDYTIIPNSLQIKPFEIPPSRNKLLSFKMKLEGEFTKELKDKTSEEYKTLEYQIIRSLTFFLESIRGFVKVIVNNFEEGSIVVKAQLLFDRDEVKVTDDEIKKDIEIKLIRYLGLLNDTIDKYKVDINSFKIDGDVVVLQNSSSFPSWLIVLIVALCVVVILIIIFIRQKRKIKKMKSFLKISVDNQPSKDLQMEKPKYNNQNNTNTQTVPSSSPRGKINPTFDRYNDLTEVTL